MQYLSDALWQMARRLQSALAIASRKAQHDMDKPAVDIAAVKRVGKKRRRSSITTSPISSSSSEAQRFSTSFASSPIQARPSYNISPGRFDERSNKRRVAQPSFTYPSPRTRSFRQSVTLPTVEVSRNSWKASQKLPEPSPESQRQHLHFPMSHEVSASFMSSTSTVADSPPLGHVSEEESSLPEHSFNRASYNFQASGPRTPPPTRSRTNRYRKPNLSEEEACLLELLSSPPPATLGQNGSGMFPPSTPPSNAGALGNLMMSTPRGGGYAAPITPGPVLNFSEFLNMTPTPSPAQGAFGSLTPGLPNTPLAAKEARKKLHESGLAPGDGSPLMGGLSFKSKKKGTGLGMDLGGELLPH